MEGAVVDSEVLWLVIVIWIAFWTVIGGVIGNSKGRIAFGLVLGFFFSFFGVIVTALMPPTAAKLAERDRAQALALKNVLQPGSSQFSVSQQDAIAEALRRDPSLGGSNDPATMKRLSESVAEIQQELSLRAEVEAVKAREAAAQMEEASRIQAQAAAQLQAEAAAAAKLEAQRVKEERLAAMSPTKRWVASHRGLVIGLSILTIGVLASAISAVAISISNNNAAIAAAELKAKQEAEAQAVQEKAEEEYAAWVSEASSSCDPESDREAGSNAEVLTAWSKCNDPNVRVFVAMSPETPAPVIAELAADADPIVRAAVAQSSVASAEVLQGLALDPDPSVKNYALNSLQPLECVTNETPFDLRVSGVVWSGWNRVDGSRNKFVVRFLEDCTWADLSPDPYTDYDTVWQQNGESVQFSFDNGLTYDGKISGTSIVGTWTYGQNSDKFELTRE